MKAALSRKTFMNVRGLGLKTVEFCSSLMGSFSIEILRVVGNADEQVVAKYMTDSIHWNDKKVDIQKRRLRLTF